MTKLLLTTLAVFFLLGGISYSQDCTDGIIQWKAPLTDADGTELSGLSGYNVTLNGVKTDVGDVLEHPVCIPVRHKIHVTAYDHLGNESDASNLIDAMPTAPPTGCSIR